MRPSEAEVLSVGPGCAMRPMMRSSAPAHLAIAAAAAPRAPHRLVGALAVIALAAALVLPPSRPSSPRSAARIGPATPTPPATLSYPGQPYTPRTASPDERTVFHTLHYGGRTALWTSRGRREEARSATGKTKLDRSRGMRQRAPNGHTAVTRSSRTFRRWPAVGARVNITSPGLRTARVRAKTAQAPRR